MGRCWVRIGRCSIMAYCADDDDSMKENMTKKLSDLLTEMSYSRDDFKFKIGSHLAGAYGEFWKYKIAQFNGCSTDKKNGHLVDHWNREWTHLVEYVFYNNVQHQIDFKNRAKAVAETINKISGDDHYRKASLAHVKKSFPNMTISDVGLPKADAEEMFWDKVQSIYGKAMLRRADDKLKKVIKS